MCSSIPWLCQKAAVGTSWRQIPVSLLVRHFSEAIKPALCYLGIFGHHNIMVKKPHGLQQRSEHEHILRPCEQLQPWSEPQSPVLPGVLQKAQPQICRLYFSEGVHTLILQLLFLPLQVSCVPGFLACLICLLLLRIIVIRQHPSVESVFISELFWSADISGIPRRNNR